MQRPEQLPDEGDTILTHVGTGLSSPTKVKAKVHGVYDDQITYEVLSILDDGERDPDVGERYGADIDGFLWETR